MRGDPWNPATAMEGASSPPDMQQARLLRADQNFVPLSEVLRIVNSQNLPPQVRNTPYFKTFNDATPQLVIPANPQRMGFIIGFVSPADATDFVLMTYGPPPNGSSGIPIPSGGSYQEGNGTVSIDDIFINAVGLTAGIGFPFTIAAYESVLAIESHLQNQTQGLRR